MFPGATFNYAEHVLRGGDGRADDDLAVVFRREPGRHLIVVLTGLRGQSRPCDADARPARHGRHTVPATATRQVSGPTLQRPVIRPRAPLTGWA
jgi:hypothetical protein